MYPYTHPHQPPLPPRTDGRRPSEPRPAFPTAQPSYHHQPQQQNLAQQPYVAFPNAGSPGATSAPYAPHYGSAAGPAAPFTAQPTYPTPTTTAAYSGGSPHGSYPSYQQPSATGSQYSSAHSLASVKSDVSDHAKDLEAKLQRERDERRKLEEREFERVKSMSMLEDQLHSMKLDMRQTAERAGMAAEIESKLHHEQEEKRRLLERLGAAAQIESRLEHEIEERRRLEQSLYMEKSEKQQLQEKISSLNNEESVRKEREEKQFLERRLADLELRLRDNQKALEESENRKMEATKNLDMKNIEISSLKRQLDQGVINQEKQKLDKMRADMEGILKAKDSEIAGLVDRLNRDAFDRNASAQQLRELQLRYEPPAPPIGDEALYHRAPPSQPLPIPKGVDHELWQLFVMVDPYQLRVVNAIQLRDIINHGPWPPLEYSTVRILHNVYDRTGKSFKFDDFAALWDLIHSWVDVFRANDHHTDEAEFGHVDRKDLRKVLKECGIAASERFLTALLTRGYRQERPLGWDDFMRCAATVKLMQDSFRKIDMDKDNWITINYDQFLDLVVNSSV
ncbi:hypothetical protein PhCBS80983_g04866 [Powellomyces hirtus]|uniref:EF-hand domain-containing protein n=1 Tax=Powellomyces hirtus TaxID=109895 RepID=A0A507DXD2_9FUNG|nr:hypothetical protein PhCBS80983_g04866 [Powellomyces hirtus]